MTGQYVTTVHPGGHVVRIWTDVNPLPVPIRRITLQAFLRRMLQGERNTLRTSADPDIVDIYEDLKLRGKVDLDDSVLIAQLTAIPGLSTARRSVLLADGVDGEL